jgi:hypothetical protein
MARSRKSRSKPLGYYDLRRFTVTGCEGHGKRVYTSVVDAMLAARHCSRDMTSKPKVSHGMPGAEKLIASCEERRCKTAAGKRVTMRQLYEAEQQGNIGIEKVKGERERPVRNVRAKGARKVKLQRGGRKVF